MAAIIVAGKEFSVDAPVIHFRQAPYWDATSERCSPTKTEPSPPCQRTAAGDVPYGKLPTPYTRRYALRPALRRYGLNPPIEAAKAVIRQFVLHHDGCASADMCWNVLHNERGLSCHFLIDNDGTIYQTLDLALMAYHAAEFNIASIGVEFCNRGDAKRDPNFYDRRGGPARDVRPCRINAHTYLAYDYTQPQYQSFTQLAKALTRILPNIPVEYPQASPGEQSWETLPHAASFAGYLGHYHCTTRKWDPGPFDFKAFCKRLRGSYCFPLFPQGDAPRAPEARPEIPSSTGELASQVEALARANQERAEGGYFPVGPWGEARLWHGGLHLPTPPHAPVFAPFPGRLVAARMTGDTAVGSANFVLLRHDLSLGQTPVRFYTLLMHLQRQDIAALGKALGRTAEDVVLLDEPVEAGQQLGTVGSAGPAELAKPQLHFEIFAANMLFDDLPDSPWQLIDGSAGGRFCDAPAINDLLDENRDGALSRDELSTFFGAGDDRLASLVTLHVSEWTAQPDWTEALRQPKDFQHIDKAAIAELVATQLTPTLWWSEAVARHARLPIDGVVYHYHPLRFLRWFHEQLLAAKQGTAATAAEARETPAGVTDDLGDIDGTSMRSANEVTGDPCDESLTLEQMVLGYDAPECQP